MAKARKVLASASSLAVSEMKKSFMEGRMGRGIVTTGVVPGLVGCGLVGCGLATSVLTGLSVVSGLMAGPYSSLKPALFAVF